MKKHKLLITTLLMTLLLSGSSLTAFAGLEETQAYVNEHGVASGHGTTVNPGTGNYEYTVTYNGTTYYIDEAADQYYANRIQNSNSSDDVKSQIDGMYTIGEGGEGGLNLDIQGGIKGAGQMLSGLSGPLSLVLGILVTLLTLGMTVFTALDLCFIVFPVFRGKCEGMKQEGRMVDRGRTQKSGETKLRFISDEAEYAINAAETTQTGQNPVIIYGKKRALAIIVLAVVIFILLTGNFTVVINLALKLVSGILEMIQSIG